MAWYLCAIMQDYYVSDRMFVGHLLIAGNADISSPGRHFMQAWDKAVGDPKTV